MKTIVIGGGPAGCAAAYTLKKQGHEVDLFEADNIVGGRTKQLERDGFSLATGALFLMGGIYPRTMALLKEMGHYKELVPWKGKTELADKDNSRYLVRFDSLLSFIKLSKLTFSDKFRLAKEGLKLVLSSGPKNMFSGTELAVYDKGENLGDWTSEKLGKNAHEYIMRPIMDFLYAVPLKELSTPFPKAIIQQAYKLKLTVPPKGIGQVSSWLVENLPEEKVHLSSPVDRIEKEGGIYKVHANGKVYEADALVVATESFIAAKLLREFISDDVNTKLMETPYTDYAHVAFAYEKNPWPDYPVDMVLPVGEDEERNIGAILLHGRRSASSVPEGGEVAGVYFNTPPLAHMSDDEIIEEAMDMVHRCFGEAPEPSFVKLFRYENGLTIAKPGHYGRLDSVHDQMPKGVFLAGDYFSQAGVEAAVFSGEHAANQLHESLA